MKSTVLCVAAAIACSALLTKAESASGMICIDTSSTIPWKTVPGVDPEVQLDRPDGDGVEDLVIGAEDGYFYFAPNPRSGR